MSARLRAVAAVVVAVLLAALAWAAFAPIASRILVAKAPGPMAADPGDLPWRHLSAGTAPRP